MRLIGAAPEEQIARRFEDYLLSRGIDATVEAAGDGWQVWVHHDDHFEPARQEWNTYLNDPQDFRYQDSDRIAQKMRSEKERRASALRDKHIDVRTNWAKSRWVHGPTPLTYALIAISVVVFFASEFGRNFMAVNVLRIAPVELREQGVVYAAGLAAIRRGEVWRLVTPIFMHYGLMHILFNMMLLLRLGGLIEVRRGTWMLLFLVLASAIPSNLLQYWWSGPLFGGMSGVVYALFGYVWMKGKTQPGGGLELHPDMVFILIAWLFISMTGWVGPIANAAHVGGLLVGMAIGVTPYALKKIRQRLR